MSGEKSKKKSVAISLTKEELRKRKETDEENLGGSITKKKIKGDLVIVPEMEFMELKDISKSQISIDTKVKMETPFIQSDVPIPAFEQLPETNAKININDEVADIAKIKHVIIRVDGITEPIYAPPFISFENISANFGIPRIDEKIPTLFKESEEKEIKREEETMYGDAHGNYSNLEGEFLFEEIFQGDNVGGLLDPTDRARVIFVPDEETAEVLTIFLKEFYRMQKGGYPRVIIKKTYDEKFEEALYDITAEKRIFIIYPEVINRIFPPEDKDKKWKSPDEKWKRDMFIEKIKEINFQSLGYLIFVGSSIVEKKNTSGEEVKVLVIANNSVVDTLSKEVQRWIRIRYINKNAVLSVFNPQKIPQKEEISSKDILKFEEKYYQKLMKTLREDIEIGIKAKTQEEFNGRESELHYALKVMVAKYLMEKGYPFEIEGEGDKKRPDIIVGTSQAYEIETFYGVGPKIYRKLEEKTESSDFESINFVVPPIQAIFYQRELLRYLKYKQQNYKKKIKIYTVDVLADNIKYMLIEIGYFYKRIKNALSENQ